MSETGNSKRETRHGADDQAGYMRLDAWKLSDELAFQLFRLTNRLPPNQGWLRSQVMRAATSLPANLAEGYSRTSNRELLQFLSVARGSLAEVEYYLHFLTRVELLDEAKLGELRDLCKRARQTLFGLMKSVRSDLPETRSNKRYLRESEEEYRPAPE